MIVSAWDDGRAGLGGVGVTTVSVRNYDRAEVGGMTVSVRDDGRAGWGMTVSVRDDDRAGLR